MNNNYQRKKSQNLKNNIKDVLYSNLVPYLVGFAVARERSLFTGGGAVQIRKSRALKIQYRFLKELDILLLNKDNKCRFSHFCNLLYQTSLKVMRD